MTFVHFLLTFIICLIVFVAVALYLSHSRRRLQHTRHGLTVMCHQRGGAICPSCRDQSKKNSAAS